MKQRIAVSGITPTSGYGLKIQAVYQLNNELIAVTKLHIPANGTLVNERPHQEENAVIVKTDAVQQLTVRHFLVGHSEPALEDVSDINNYMSKNGGSTSFVPIASIEKISHMLREAKCIYKPRADGMKALRLGRVEDGQEITAFNRSDANNQNWIYFPDQMKAIVNINVFLEDGLLKVVLEGITAKEDQTYYHDIGLLFEQQVRVRDGDTLSLERDLLMGKDDEVDFYALCAQTQTTFTTTAVEFTIPTHNPGMVLNFARILDKVISEAQKESDYAKTYRVVQISLDSIYSCFKDLLISNISRHIIENDMPISIEAFLSRPGSSPAPESVGSFLLEIIKSNSHLLEYTTFREFLISVYKPGMSLEQLKPEIYLEQIFDAPMNTLHGDSALEDRLAIVTQLEDSLCDAKKFNKVKPFLAEFNAIAIRKLIEPLIYKKTAPGGGLYTFGYTEFALLLTANFCLRKDGRVSIKLKDNPGYQEYYAPGKQNHDICEMEFKHLAKALNLGFSWDSDFHDEMIFDHASSLVLRGLGVHINETNLQVQLNHGKTQISAVRSSFYGKAAPESMSSARTEQTGISYR